MIFEEAVIQNYTMKNLDHVSLLYSFRVRLSLSRVLGALPVFHCRMTFWLPRCLASQQAGDLALSFWTMLTSLDIKMVVRTYAR